MLKSAIRNILVLLLFSQFLKSGTISFVQKTEAKGFSTAISFNYHNNIEISTAQGIEKVSIPKRIRKIRGIEVDVPKILNPSLEQAYIYNEYLSSNSNTTFLSSHYSCHRKRGPPLA